MDNLVQVIVFDIDGDGTILDTFQSGTISSLEDLEYTPVTVHLTDLQETLECDAILVMECAEA